MPRFFSNVILNDVIEIVGNDAKHISKVLRMNIGEHLTVCDLKGYDYECKIKAIDAAKVTLKIEKKRKSVTEPSVKISLYQGVPKGDKFDFIVQKAVELGVSEIIPVCMERCIVRIEEKNINKKIERYNRIALEAAKQSNRSQLPVVKPFVSYIEALNKMQQSDFSILFYEKSNLSLKSVIPDIKPKRISIIVGPEGGFSNSEIQIAQSLKVAIASMGKRILRCETAPMYALSVLMFLFEN